MYEDAGCAKPCGGEPFECGSCGYSNKRLPDGVDDFEETHYVNDLEEWETEQVFQDHEGWDGYEYENDYED